MTNHAGQGAPERSFLSIREVLDLLVEEFPDVTISKIRFLESRGLIHPERTASGYRKFYETDVERLRWILREQREHFLPLKVIKGRLEQVSGTATGPIAPSLFDGDFSDPPDELGEFVGAVPAWSGGLDAAASVGAPNPGEFDEFFEGPGDDEEGARGAEDLVTERPGEFTAETGSRGEPAGGETVKASRPTTRRRVPRTSRAAAPPASGKAEARTRKPARQGEGKRPRGRSSEPGGPVAGYSPEELAGAVGVEPRVIAELDAYGLIAPVEMAGVRAYRPEALDLARLAVAFGKFGIEPRHLRTFKHAAEREAGLFSQVVTPLLYQRNPEARGRARAELKELVELGASLHEAFVKVALDDLGRG